LLTLREEHKLRVLKNRVLREKFEPKNQKETGELYDLASPPILFGR
jgi:hypothetical protein